MLYSVRAHMIILSLLLGLTMSLDLVSGKTPTRINLGGVNVTANTFPIIMVGNDDNSLVCYIDDATNTVWLFPNGTEVTSRSTNEVPTDTIIYFKLQFVLIPDRVYLRRGPSVRSPGGSYCCGSATNVTLRLCVNLVLDCATPPSISNGSPGTPNNTQLGGSVTYTCDNGYQISPGITLTTASCQATGNWETVPTCLPVDSGLTPSDSEATPSDSGATPSDSGATPSISNQSSPAPCPSCSQCSNIAVITSAVIFISVVFFVLLAVTAVAIAHLVLRQHRVGSKKCTSVIPHYDKGQSSHYENANIADVIYDEIGVPYTLKGSYEFTRCQAYETTPGCK